MTRRVLVTGAAGFIGSHLVDALLDAGHEVVGVDAFTNYYDPAIKRDNLVRASERNNFRLIEGSLNDIDLPELVDGVDCVFHEAAQAGVRASWGHQFETYIDSNVRATQRLCESMKGAQGARLIYASSSSVYGQTMDLPMREDHPTRPNSPYGVTKLDGENMCLLYRANYGVKAVCLRYFTVYGPRQRPDMALHRFIKSALTGEPARVYGNGEQTRDFTFVSDIVAANLSAMEYTGDHAVFNIGGGSRVSINDTLDGISAVLGTPIVPRYSDRETGDVLHTFADTSLARCELEFDPKVGLEEGLAREAEWMRARLG